VLLSSEGLGRSSSRGLLSQLGSFSKFVGELFKQLSLIGPLFINSDSLGFI
jgi:hypothetical protein